MIKTGALGRAVLLAGLVTLAACEDGGGLKLGLGGSGDDDAVATAPATRASVERDVEAPEVFQVTDSGLWDGRPSLGGVWVAHPEVDEPERVIIRNPANDSFVIGALFRRERNNPGPVLQVSSDAAEALGMIAGQPQKLNVTALRREETEAPVPTPGTAPQAVDPDDPDAPAPETALAAADTISTTPLDSAGSAPMPAPTPSAAPAAGATSSLSRPFIQIGIFSVEQNAQNAAASLRNIGVTPTVRTQQLQGKSYWRVVAGPATTATERDALLAKVKGLGYNDAYFVAD
ncbi:SPOR domain-containing protein [Mesobaculum littorinae]|uniref:SPOR domain-containing protein n=1 Tax=Mesobaculum littorinae TaxID=2486419 RepID=A0A438AF28_9RHOB|nr:SPOR domain-containing protein [Mesobaculum littorinae]RVV97225.1 SPOR domain-containing protein [Mesobaculum littorinae]